MIHPHSSHTNNHLNHHHLSFHRNNKHHHCQEDLFQSYSTFSSCDEDESSINDVKPLPSLTMSQRVMITQDVKMSDIRSQLISHKLLLTNLIKVKESEVRNLVKKTKQRIKKDDLLDEPDSTYLDKLLDCSRNSRISSKFPHNLMSIRKGICCFEDDVLKCDKPSLPFSRHCQRHILYNVDQLLFVRCTAKDNETLTQCCNPSLDVLADEPLCNHHRWIKSSTPSMQEDDALKANVIGSGSGKGKGKIQAGPGRPGKRTKKRRKLIGGKGIPGGSIDSIDSSSFLSQDSSDSIFVNSENCDTSQVHLYAIKIEPNIDTATSLSIESGQPNQQTCIVPTIPQTMPLQMQQQTHHQHHRPQQHQPLHLNHVVPSSHLPNERSTLDNLTVIPGATLLLRGEQSSITQPLASTVPVVLPDAARNGIITGHLDGVTTLAPSDEALVASLVAELPTLCAENGPEPEPPGFVDADLTDVLNKIPDDAFNDLFVDNLKNGDIPSKEESEALEQALAAVSKNVQYLSVAAAAVGGSRSAVNNASREGITSVTSTTVINGDSSYYSHAAQHHNHHSTVNGEIPQLSHHQTLPVNTLTTPSPQLAHQPPTQPPPPTLSSATSTSSAPPSSISSSHDLASRSIASTSLNLNENDILGLANNILTSLTTEQQQHLNGLIDGALASGTLTPPTIKSALASLSSLQQESESCETHL